jgi:hypothetical protein
MTLAPGSPAASPETGWPWAAIVPQIEALRHKERWA